MHIVCFVSVFLFFENPELWSCGLFAFKEFPLNFVVIVAQPSACNKNLLRQATPKQNEYK